MENKKSFVLYADLIHTVNKLPDDKAGLLFKHILSYVNDEHPSSDDIIIDIAFEPIKQQLKRDLVKWGEIRSKRSDAGKKSAEKRAQQKSTNSTSVKSVQQSSTNPTVSVNVNDSVSDSETKTIIDWGKLVIFFNEVTNKKTQKVSSKAKKQINARLKEGYTKNDLMKAVVNCSKDSYHIENNLKWLTLEFISRESQFDKWLNTIPTVTPKKSGFAWD